MTEIRLIWKPSVHAVATTEWRADGLHDWAGEHGLLPAQDDEDTPIARIVRGVTENGGLDTLIEFAGRHCYRSWSKGRKRQDYIRNIIEQGHESVLEHASITWAISGVSRALSHELVRHRVGVAISQESQRFVKPDDNTGFVVPPLLVNILNGDSHDGQMMLDVFTWSCEDALGAYDAVFDHVDAAAVKRKQAAECARALIPNAMETRLVWSTNLRLLRHFFCLRGSEAADLEIRRLAVVLFERTRKLAPLVFADFSLRDGPFGVPVIVQDAA